MQIRQIIARLEADSGVAKAPPHTCDGYKTGCPDAEATGVVTTFMATASVIREAHRRGANLIITHEPTFFTGHDTTAWCEADAVYREKRALLERTGVTIWRYHDKMHMAQPDGIYDGFLREMGWQSYARPAEEKSGGLAQFVEHFSDYYDIPATTLGALALECKEKLGMRTIQLVGDPAMPCARVGVLVGGGSLGFGTEEMPMQLMERHHLDVILCGEITEWTTAAYCNDARQLGIARGMIVLGHERSEEWGMKHLAARLAPLVDVPVSFVDAEEPFVYL